MKNDIEYKLRHTIRGRYSGIIKKEYKQGSIIDSLGCSIEELKIYLEKQFYPHPETGERMTWDNYGLHGWHIDHIKPLISFNLTNKEQLMEACHYTNLQPLWAKENLSKGAKIAKEFGNAD